MRYLPRGFFPFLRSHVPELILGICVLLYFFYFSLASILRIHVYAAHYFDLGIMHQTTYNTYKAMASFDPSRFLELTDPYGSDQLKRMAIHNDLILALLAPFYFLAPRPETLLVIQTVVIALGGVGLFLAAGRIFGKRPRARWLALSVALAYLIYPFTNYTNLFDFHGVALSMGFIPFMVYFWLVKRHGWSMVFAVLSMLTKEQVSLSIAFFGIFAAFSAAFYEKKRYWRDFIFPAVLFLSGITWFFFSMKVVIPAARPDGTHFALEYYGEFGDSAAGVVVNVLRSPIKIGAYLFEEENIGYLRSLFFPVAYLPLFGLPALFSAAPEFGINILSSNANMRMIMYHYAAVLIPFIFVAAIYGLDLLWGLLEKQRHKRKQAIAPVLALVLLGFSIAGAYWNGPLPLSAKPEVYMFGSKPDTREDLLAWADRLADDTIKVAATGKFAPYFTSRRYFYLMSDRYEKADYVLVNPEEVYTSYGSEWAVPGYEALLADNRYKLVFERDRLQVFQRVADTR